MNLRANCIGLWKMNDNAANKTVVDSSGNGNDGEAQQNTEDLHTDGKINGALTFNGSSDFIVATIIDCITKAGTYSFSVWLYQDATEQVTIFRNAPASDDRCCMIIKYDVLRFGYYNGTSWVSKSGGFNTGQWVHAVGINNGGTLSLYIDNVLQTGEETPFCGINANYIYLGATGLPAIFFNGKMDCIMIFDKALSEEEVAFLWNEGKGREHLGTARLLVGGSLASGRKGLA